MSEGLTQAHESMTITHFEHLGEIVVRPRTNRDIMNTIPTVTDRRLEGNMNPSMSSRYNASLEAVMEVAVVHPPGLVDIILDSENPRDLKIEIPIDKDSKEKRVVNVFQQFSEDYENWISDRIEQLSGKKSGKAKTESGKESAS